MRSSTGIKLNILGEQRTILVFKPLATVVGVEQFDYGFNQKLEISQKKLSFANV